MIIAHTVGQMAENCYVVYDPDAREALVVDPGDDAEHIKDTIERSGLTPVRIIATHGHFDHIMAAYELQLIYRIGFFMHDGDAFLLDRMGESARRFLGVMPDLPPPELSGTLHAGDVIPVGRLRLTVMHVPGHTPGSIALYGSDEDVCIVGDLIFSGGGVGRTDFSYSSPLRMEESLSSVLNLPERTVIYPGHGPATTVAAERVYRAKGV
jgi:glyoxylase-like metal-dependent hydrolase (beta-lactamase superfamily II)